MGTIQESGYESLVGQNERRWPLARYEVNNIGFGPHYTRGVHCLVMSDWNLVSNEPLGKLQLCIESLPTGRNDTGTAAGRQVVESFGDPKCLYKS